MTWYLILNLPFLFFPLPEGVILPVEESAPSSAGPHAEYWFCSRLPRQRLKLRSIWVSSSESQFFCCCCSCFEIYSSNFYYANLSLCYVCFCRDIKVITEVIKVTRLQENPRVGPDQGWCHCHSLQLQLWEVKAKTEEGAEECKDTEKLESSGWKTCSFKLMLNMWCS